MGFLEDEWHRITVLGPKHVNDPHHAPCPVLPATMKPLARFVLAVSLAIALPQAARALSAEDVARAQKILKGVAEVVAKLNQPTLTLTAPAPLTNQTGAFFLPYTSKGELTGWASKALNAQLGAAVGEKAGEEAGKALASKIPFGGLLGGTAKSKGKELGAIAAVGGLDYIKSTSDLSFNTLEDFAVYLHVKHANDGEFSKALATAIAIYPALEKGYPAAVKSAYDKAAKAAAAAAKATK